MKSEATEKWLISDEEVADRVLYAFVTEALLCLDEGVLHSSRDRDVASVLGIGFPRDLGGPFHYVNSIGAQVPYDVITRLDGGTGNFEMSDYLRAAVEY